MYLNDVFTVPASLAGIPGASIPAGLSADGLPLGLQVLTRRWDEETLFRVCQALEDAAQQDDGAGVVAACEHEDELAAVEAEEAVGASEEPA